jgi:tRNA 2-thiouridine synthesizing protein E
MAESMKEILNPSAARKASPAFPHAPAEWDETIAIEIATKEGLALEDHHWVVVKALQEFFARNGEPKAREMHDALDEKFHDLGGLKFLYTLLPGGPVAQGCRLAGLKAPVAAEDGSSGSVQ